MEQPCYKCGQVVEQGRPFCQQCAAPQIRVVVAEPAATLSPTAARSDEPPSTQPAIGVSRFRSQALRACSLAMLIASALMALGLNIFVGMLGAGFIAVFFYRQRDPGTGVKLATGARLGALSGFLCFFVLSLLSVAAVLVPEARAKLYAQMLDNAQKMVAAHPEIPQLQDGLAQLKDPHMFVVAMIFGGIFMLIFSMALGGVGGTLGALVFRARKGR